MRSVHGMASEAERACYMNTSRYGTGYAGLQVDQVDPSLVLVLAIQLGADQLACDSLTMREWQLLVFEWTSLPVAVSV